MSVTDHATDDRPRTDAEVSFARTGGTPIDDPGAPARLIQRRRRGL